MRERERIEKEPVNDEQLRRWPEEPYAAARCEVAGECKQCEI